MKYQAQYMGKKTRWYATPEQAWEKLHSYEHRPGVVAGDAFSRDYIEGVRHHGLAYINMAKKAPTGHGRA